MVRIAHVIDGVVVNISIAEELNGLIDGELAAIGDSYQDGQFVKPVLSISHLKRLKIIELAALRYQHETAGITLSGMTIETNRESQALITGAWSFSQLNPAVLIDWKGTNGWVQIDAATISAIAGAVAAHVQSCFSTERVHAEAISALETSEEVSAYDLTTGWPG